MVNYDYSYIINDNSVADEIFRTAISEGGNGSLVMLIIDGSDISVKNYDFGENVTIVISEGSDNISLEGCTFGSYHGGIKNNGTRVLFKQCVFEFGDIAIKSTGFEIFEDCTFRCRSDEAAVISARRNEDMPYKLNYTVIINSRVYADNNGTSLFITDGDASVTAINVEIYNEKGYTAWTKDMVNENTFSYYNCTGISGINECGYELSEQYINIYSSAKLLSKENNDEAVTYYINIDKNISFTAGRNDTEIVMYYYPRNIRPVYSLECVGNISVREKECREGSIVFEVTGENDGEEPEYGFISFNTKEGVKAECVAKVKPSIIEPPKFLSTPQIVIKDGRAVISYELDLRGREDLSEISWYRVDNIDRTKLVALREFARSNEKDCRKIAITRNKPCREIGLTPFDIGRHLKVNIKPRHARSETGPGLNVISRIVMQSDIKSENIVINIENQVLNPYYREEPGYGTATGIWLYKRLQTCRYYDMVTESNECGYYFGSDIPRENMTIYTILDFENNNGEGFGSKGEYQEIYIKYDVNTKTGYGIRYECVDVSNHIAGIALYKYDGLMSQPISETITGSFLKSGMDIKLDIYKNIFTALILMPDIDEPIKLSARVDGNMYSGMGIRHHSVSVENNRVGIRHIEMSFPN